MAPPAGGARQRAALDRARPAPARDARRAGADVRQVRAAALDAPGHRPAGHHHRAAGAPGRRQAVSVLRGRAHDRRGAGAPAREALPRVRGAADGGGVDRPGAPRGAAERAARRGQGAAAGRAAEDRGRSRAPLPGGAPREGTRACARLHRRARARRRVRAVDPPRARLPAGGPQRAGVPPPLRRPPARPHPARLLELLAPARADARDARGNAARRHRARRLHARGAATAWRRC